MLVDDVLLLRSVNGALARNVERNRDHVIKPYVFGGVVLLVGNVSDEQTKQEITNTVLNVSNVGEVHNHIEISPRPGLGARGHDEVLRNKIRWTLRTHPHISATKIGVVIWDDVVYLMGLVDEEAGLLAAEAASRVAGTRAIVTIYAYSQGESS